MRSSFTDLLRIAISLLGITAILLTQDLRQVLRLLTQLDARVFLGALALFLSGSFVRSFRWGSLVWALGIQVSWMRLTSLFFVGTFYNLFLPTGVGGDAVKMYELSRDGGDAALAISSVLVDRFLGLFVLFTMALLMLVGSSELVGPEVRIVIVAGFFACLVGAISLSQRTRIEALGRRLGLDRPLRRWKFLGQLYETVQFYDLSALMRATAASVIWNLLLILTYYLLGVAVGIELSASHYLLLVPVISLLLLIPSVGGLGIQEGATVLLFSRLGVSGPQALALALAYDVVIVAVALVGACVYILQGLLGIRREKPRA